MEAGLMPDEEKGWYELVKRNFVTPDPTTDKVLRTVQGLGHAQRMADVLTERLTDAEKEAGFQVFQRRGTKPSGLKGRRPAPHQGRRYRR